MIPTHAGRRLVARHLGMAALMTGGLMFAPSASALGPKSGRPPAAPEGQPGFPKQGPDALLDRVGISQRLGTQLPLELEFRTSTGERRTLDSLIGRRPVVFAFVYYECPMLCTMVLNGMLRMMNVLKFDVGREYDVITLSIDPRETEVLAAEKKKVYLDRYRRSGAVDNWHFLVGDEESITKLSSALGYDYAYDETTDQYAHGSAIMVITPDGKVSKYFYGIDYSPVDVRLALIEASEERIGSITDAILLSCFQYNPLDGKYSLVVMGVVRIAGILTVLGILAFIVWNYFRGRRESLPVGAKASPPHAH